MKLYAFVNMWCDFEFKMLAFSLSEHMESISNLNGNVIIDQPSYVINLLD